MPRAAAMTSVLKVASAAFAQASTGEWKPAAVTWANIKGVACRIFPATEAEIQRVWGEALKIDAICWVLPGTVSLPAQVLTSGSGVAVPCQVDGIQYMAVRARDLAHFGKVTAIALRRFTHG